MTKDSGVGRVADFLRSAARILPLLALAAWVVTIWVPVLDSAKNSLHSGDSMRIVVTSLGRIPDTAAEFDFDFVTIWCCLLTCVISVWLCDGLRLWSWAASGFGIAVLIFLSREIADPPTIMWDGQDSSGRWVGGMEVATPVLGAVLWAIGGIALIAAGICGLIGERHRSGENNNVRSSGKSNGLRSSRKTNGVRSSGKSNGLRISRWFSTESGRDGRIRVRRHRFAAERIARLLPLVSVAAWVVMIWVPIFANRAAEDSNVTVTSLGRIPISFSDIGLDVVLPWTAVILCAAVAWLFDPPLWWSIIVVLIGLALFIMLEMSMIDPPSARFLITDSSEDLRGGRIIGYPDAGVRYWILGSGALVVAGLAGIAGRIGDRRRSLKAPRRRQTR